MNSKSKDTAISQLHRCGDLSGNRYSSVVEVIDEAISRYSSLPAFVCGTQSLTYEQLQLRSMALSSSLRRLCAFEIGDRVAIMLPNVIEFPIALLGVLRSKGIHVSINPMYTSRELNQMLHDSEAVALIAFEPMMQVVQSAINNTNVRTVIHVGSQGAMYEFESDQVSHFDFDCIANASEASNTTILGIQSQVSDIAVLQYTGGTTGVPKGAKLTHGNLIANILQLESLMKAHVVYGEETIVTAIPLYHIFALTVNCFTYMRFGARIILVPDPRDPKALVSTFVNNRVTIMTGVNTLFNSLLSIPDLQGEPLSSIKLSFGGGSAIHRSVSTRWREVTGSHIVEGYGLSETSPVATLNVIGASDFSGNVGFPLPGTEVFVRRTDGSRASVGEAGEICIRGPQVMAGYWRRYRETREVMTDDGFLRTGDIGSFDKDGSIRIEDRLKDMILVSGFNVYPSELEGVISQLPGVFEVAVVGIPDERTGESPKAFVVLQKETLTQEDVIKFCRSNLAPYKVPKAIEFVRELPKSSVGKILRRELRATN